MHCPHGWCPPVATCEACRKAGKHKLGHESCKARVGQAKQRKNEFLMKPMHLSLRFCEKYGYILDEPREFYSDGWCEFFRACWVDAEQLPRLATLGHTYEVTRITDN